MAANLKLVVDGTMEPRGQRYDAFISYSHALDGNLAPAVQRGLSRFAKSWRRMRALRIFRDETSLAVTPALWPSIQEALDESRFLILFASPEAAASDWVGRELDHWCEHRSPDTILLALTGGSLLWDEQNSDFDWAATDAVPPTARGRFSQEPRFVDLRWARTEQDLSLRHPRFREAVADLAATLHGRPKDELIGEDVRQHGRTIRLVRTVIATITAFAVLASVLAVTTWQARNRAERERQVATSRFLAAAAINSMDQHLDRAALLSVEALTLRDTAEARNALLTTVQRTPDARRYLRSAGAGVADVAVTPGGTVAAAIDENGLLTIWDTRSGLPIRPPVIAHDGSGIEVAFSSDGRRMATGGGDGTFAVWETLTLAPVGRIRVADPAVRSLAFSPDGKWLAAGGGASTTAASLLGFSEAAARELTVYDNTTGKYEITLTGHTGSVEDLSFSRDSRRIYSASVDFDTGMLWWDTRTWEGEQISFPKQVGRNTGMDLSPDGKRAAVAGNLSETPLVWDLTKNRKAADLTGLTEHVSGLDYSPEGDFVAAATFGGEVGVWPTDDLTVPVRRLAGHDRNIEGGGTVVAFGPDGMLVSGSSDGAVVLHDLTTTSRLVTDAGPADEDASGTIVGNNHGWFAYNPDDSRAVRLRDTRTGEERTLQLPVNGRLSEDSALSPDGGRLTAGIRAGDQEALAVVDTRSGKELWRVDGTFIGAAFAPADDLLAAADDQGVVALFDAGAGTRLATLPAQPPVAEEQERYERLGIVLQADRAVLAFDRSGQTLAVAGPDGPVWLWDVADRVLSSPDPLLGHGRVSSMAFNPGGDVLATGGDDELIRLWNVPEAALIGLTSERPQGRVYALAFSPDGRTLISQSPEHEFWDVASRQRLGEPLEVGDPLSKMAFDADGGTLTVVTPQNALRRVNTDIGAWTGIAREIANRSLTPDETRQFLSAGQPAN